MVPSDEMLAQQIAWEEEGLSRGIAAYHANFERTCSQGGGNATGPGAALVGFLFKPLKARIEAEQQAVWGRMSDRKPKPAYDSALISLDADLIAVLAASGMVAGLLGPALHDGVKRASICKDLGSALQAQIALEQFKEGEKIRIAGLDAEGRAEKKNLVDLAKAFQRQFPAANARQWRVWQKRIGAHDFYQWTPEAVLAVGAFLADACAEVSEGRIFKDTQMVKGKSSATYRLSSEYLQHMGIENSRLETMRPRLLPMLVPPRTWTPSESTQNTSGGFLTQRISLVRSEVYTHSAAGVGTVSALDLEAMNRVQSTAWQVNRGVFEVILEAAQEGIKLPAIPLETDRDVDFRDRYAGWDDFVSRFHAEGRRARLLPDAEWDALTPEAKTAVKRDILAFHEGTASSLGRRYALSEALTTASELSEVDAFYYPFNRDFRGRIYPMTLTELQPQGSDYAKALLRFSKGKVLGASGLRWLLIHVANCAGEDKLSLAERVAWSLDNLEGILASAADPFECLWWAYKTPERRLERNERDSPWMLLAACFELAAAWAHPDGPEAFVSHLPVAVDGTCNGLQHLSAMGRDPVGAAATNLLPLADRQDIYLEVAGSVREALQEDMAAGNPNASAWFAEFSGTGGRKIVKRAVMTTPYGVTNAGIAQQIMKEGFTKSLNGKGSELSAYMRDLIQKALTQKVSKAKEIMAWLQSAAFEMGRVGLPFCWTTPTGSKIVQAYRNLDRVTVNTLSGRLWVYRENPQSTLDLRKQSAGSAPNLVHSFDAAHLFMAVQRFSEGVEEVSVALIHDSYGAHAADVERLGRCIREAFVEIYSQDWIQKLQAEFTAYAPHAMLPEPPTLGAFEVEKVLGAEFFFS